MQRGAEGSSCCGEESDLHRQLRRGPDEGGNQHAISMQSACNQHAISLHSEYAIRGHQGTVDASTSSAPQLLIALHGWIG